MFLGLFLAALDEELVGLYTCIGMDKPASALSVEELDEEARSAETKMGKRDYTVRRFSFSMQLANVADICLDTTRRV